MPADIALHPASNPVHGQRPAFVAGPTLFNQTSLAEATNSNTITVPDMGALLVLQATAKLRVDIRAASDQGNLNPGASGVVLMADIPRTFYLPRGSYILRTIVYV
jgi:hypothetical protein